MNKRINIRYSPTNMDIAYIFDDKNNCLDIIQQVNKIDNSKIKRKIGLDFSNIGGGN